MSSPFIGMSQWIPVYTGTNADFWVVDFVDSQTGYCSGGHRDTFKTIDGGQTWAKISEQGFNDFSFFNETIGYATSSSVDVEIAKTINGGDSWFELTAPVPHRVVAVSATNETTAYFAGNGGVLYKTTDGGGSFSILNSGNNWGIGDILFTNGTTGYLVSLNIKKTTDSGATWNTIFDMSNGTFSRICFVNENIGYIAGDSSVGAAIWKTTDAGNSWILQNPGIIPGYLIDIDFYDENHGFAVGLHGLILYTDNGGVSWTLQESGTTSRLNSVKMTSPTNAVVVGYNGTLLRNFGSLGLDDDIISDKFALFPNPVDNDLIITGSEELASIQVFNVLGNLLFENYKVFSKNHSIDFSTYSKGVYFIKISDEKGNTIVKKVIKK